MAVHRWVLLAALVALGACASPRPAVHGAKQRKSRRRPLTVQALAISEPGLKVEELTYEEPQPLPADSVEVEVHACALSTADTQQLRGDWGPCLLPLVPGREAVGVVTAAGKSVKNVIIGQRVGVLLGTGMDSEDEDSGADRGMADVGTMGAASHRLRVPARWAFALPLPLASAPATGLLATGGAIWSQLTHKRMAKGARVGIIGTGVASARSQPGVKLVTVNHADESAIDWHIY